MPEHQAPKDQMDHQVTQVPQELMENQAIKDHVDPPAHPAHRVPQETKDRLEIPAKSLAPNQVRQEMLDLTVNPARPALQADPEKLAKMAVLVLQALPDMLVPQAVQEKPVDPVVQATQVKTALQAVANTVHQLVWLQVIKHSPRRSERLDYNFHRQIYDSKRIFIFSLIVLSSMSSKKNYKSICNFLISSQTFHVEILYFYLNAFFLSNIGLKKFSTQ